MKLRAWKGVKRWEASISQASISQASISVTTICTTLRLRYIECCWYLKQPRTRQAIQRSALPSKCFIPLSTSSVSQNSKPALGYSNKIRMLSKIAKVSKSGGSSDCGSYLRLKAGSHRPAPCLQNFFNSSWLHR